MEINNDEMLHVWGGQGYKKSDGEPGTRILRRLF